ncbi:MAG TPA: IS91 family transposase [bacterium]|nr:IS91 family transposase [bacterium]
MKKPAIEVADIFRDNLDKIGKISPEKWKVVNALTSCRTSRLGGHVYRCDNCGHEIILYNSCRNRHCPKCQGLARAKWLDNRMKELLPVEYFHVVFTMPDILNRTALCNKEVVYGILFRAVKETLLEASLNPKNIGARIGFLSILHTWGQNLLDHPHIHCVVPGGGLSDDGCSWISSKKGFLISVKILAKLFRGKVLDYLKQAFQDHKLHFYGENKELEMPKHFQKLIDQAYAKRWVVYVKKPFSGPKQLLQYLGKYTHRVAISNHRIIDVKDGRVIFKWRDYKDSNTMKTMSVSVQEFMRRFLLHVIPKRFVKIRFYGLLSNRNKKEMLIKCRAILHDASSDDETAGNISDTEETSMTGLSENDYLVCPECQKGKMFIVMVIEPETVLENTCRLDSS